MLREETEARRQTDAELERALQMRAEAEARGAREARERERVEARAARQARARAKAEARALERERARIEAERRVEAVVDQARADAARAGADAQERQALAGELAAARGRRNRRWAAAGLLAAVTLVAGFAAGVRLETAPAVAERPALFKLDRDAAGFAARAEKR
jgi:hypothetical protein